MKINGVLAGILACALAVVGILSLGFIFVPIAAVLALIGSILAVMRFNLAGVGVNLLAWVLVAIGFFTSPVLLATVGLGIIAAHIPIAATSSSSEVSVEKSAPSSSAPPQRIKKAAEDGDEFIEPSFHGKHPIVVASSEPRLLYCGGTKAKVIFQSVPDAKNGAVVKLTLTRDQSEQVFEYDDEIFGVACRQDRNQRAVFLLNVYCTQSDCNDSFGIIDAETLQLLLTPLYMNQRKASDILGEVPQYISEVYSLALIGRAEKNSP